MTALAAVQKLEYIRQSTTRAGRSSIVDIQSRCTVTHSVIQGHDSARMGSSLGVLMRWSTACWQVR